MTDLLEKKKVIAEFMGYELYDVEEDEISHYPESRSISIIPAHIGLFKDGKEVMDMDAFNPQSDKCPHYIWMELWKAMDKMVKVEGEQKYIMGMYLLNLGLVSKIHTCKGINYLHGTPNQDKFDALYEVLMRIKKSEEQESN